jgi:hypothetical protein
LALAADKFALVVDQRSPAWSQSADGVLVLRTGSAVGGVLTGVLLGDGSDDGVVEGDGSGEGVVMVGSLGVGVGSADPVGEVVGDGVVSPVGVVPGVGVSCALGLCVGWADAVGLASPPGAPWVGPVVDDVLVGSVVPAVVPGVGVVSSG